MKTRTYFLAAAAACLLFFAASASAHKVSVFAYADSEKIYTESYFQNGDPVANGGLKVYDSSDNLVAEGVTDNQGLFSFEIPRADDFRIVIDAGMGHKSSFTLKKSSMEAEINSGGQP